jgi:hypothetical protein
VNDLPEKQISLTDPDSRSMISQAKGTGVVGYNVQVAVDTRHPLIVTREVTKACRQSFSVQYVRVVRLFEEIKITHDDGSFSRRLGQLPKVDSRASRRRQTGRRLRDV